MANPWAGEVAVSIDGTRHAAKLTLGALAELEAELGEGSLVELAERFEGARFRAADVLAVIAAGLRGAGWEGTARDLLRAEFEGGPAGAATCAAQLLGRAFAVPE